MVRTFFLVHRQPFSPCSQMADGLGIFLGRTGQERKGVVMLNLSFSMNPQGIFDLSWRQERWALDISQTIELFFSNLGSLCMLFL